MRKQTQVDLRDVLCYCYHDLAQRNGSLYKLHQWPRLARERSMLQWNDDLQYDSLWAKQWKPFRQCTKITKLPCKSEANFYRYVLNSCNICTCWHMKNQFISYTCTAKVSSGEIYNNYIAQTLTVYPDSNFDIFCNLGLTATLQLA